MSWFRREQFTKLTAPEKKLRIPEGIWHKCEKCEAIISKKDYEENLLCCTSCQEHGKLSAIQRIGQFLDPDSFEELDFGLSSLDPLGFKDRKSYQDRIRAYQKESGLIDACRSGLGTIDGMPVSIAVMDFGFIGGSMGSVVGEKVTRAIERGLERHIPVIVVSTSGGARMQEGVLSLMQMAKTSAALARLGQAGVPYISVLTHPTTAGVMASFASLGDVIIAEPNALIGFAGPRVIEQTINQILPKGFQRSDFVLEHGFVDIVCHRRELRRRIVNVLNVLKPRAKAGSKSPKSLHMEAEEIMMGEDVAAAVAEDARSSANGGARRRASAVATAAAKPATAARKPPGGRGAK